MKIKIDEIYDSTSNIEEFIKSFKRINKVHIQIPFENYQRTNVDIMLDYLCVSFLAEELATFGKRYSGQTYYEKQCCYFEICIEDFEHIKLAEHILYRAKEFSFEGYDADEQFMYVEELNEYEEKIITKKLNLHFPELIDSYYANLLNGGYHQIAYESENEKFFLKEEFAKYPERYFGYWLSAFCKDSNIDVYVSTEAWIVPSKYDFKQALILLGEATKETKFETARLFELEDKTIICNDSGAIWYNLQNSLYEARSCANTALHRYIDLVLEINETQYILSEYSDILIIKDTFFSFIFFINNAKLHANEIIKIRENLNPLHTILGSILGAKNHIKINWGLIDDDAFEELCYDIIYDLPKFDNRTIRKMGKSKSRDGGRDITIMTKATRTEESKLYIFQCKLLKDGSSLTKSKVPDAANVIIQYGAKGYGIFTNVLIDSTLYDMLDGFNENIGVYTRENWSKLEMEKHLNNYDNLREKFFN